MNPDMVEPMDIISQFKSELLRGIKNTPVNKFSFNELESGFGNGVVERISPQTQRTVDMKSINTFDFGAVSRSLSFASSLRRVPCKDYGFRYLIGCGFDF